MNNENSNGPRPSQPSQEWLKKIDIAAITEHMESGDIVEFMKRIFR